jgi:hypothetical protein
MRLERLVDAVLAGEASAAEKEALERLSAADPEVRELIEARSALFSTLDRVPLVEPPLDLRASILEAVRREAAEVGRRTEVARSGTADREERPIGGIGEDVPTGPWARMFHRKRRRSQMSNKKWILGVAAVAAVVVAVIALRGPNPGSNTQGTIGAAARYQSEQIKSSDVSLDNPQVAAFLQSDAFRKLATDAAFREAAKSDAFGRVVASDGLRDASARYDLAKVFESAYVMDLLKNDVFAKAMTDARIAEGLSTADLAYLLDNARMVDLLKMDALRDPALRADFIKLANDAARVDALSVADFAKLADNYATLKASDSFRALEGNKYFMDALQHGFLDLFRSPESAAFAVDGLRSLAESAHLADALRVDGFKSVMDALNADTYSAVVDLARAPEMLSVLSDAEYREAAKFPEMSKVADAGFVDALAKVPE